MTDTVTISRELLERIIEEHAPGYHDCIDLLGYECEWCELRAALAAQVQGEAVEEIVPKWRYDALVQHCKLQDKNIAKLSDERNTAWMYEQREVWFWQGDGEDYPESLSCPVVIKADDLRAILAPRQPEGDAHKNEAQPEVAQNTGSRSMTNKLSSQGCTGCTGVEGVAAPCETPDAVDIFAWATFDVEGSYDLRLYEDNEGYLDDFRVANPLLHPDWVFPLCRLSDAPRQPAGWKLVPERMHLDSSVIETIQAHCGDGQEDAGFGPYSDGVLWIGECEEEDGSKTYGLHIATADYPEEGSSTLVEFAAAPSAPATVQGDGWIPISERLPQIKQVLSEKCTLEGREIPTLYRSGMVLTFDGSRVSAGIVEWFHSKSPLNNVTHWMPLPAAPEVV